MLREIHDEEERIRQANTSLSFEERTEAMRTRPYQRRVIKSLPDWMLEKSTLDIDYLYRTIDESVVYYLHNVAYRPSRKQVKETLDQVATDAVRLGESLRQLSGISWSALDSIAMRDEEWSLDAVNGYRVPLKRPEHLYPFTRQAMAHHAVERLADWAGTASRQLPVSRGRTPDLALDNLVLLLVNFGESTLVVPFSFALQKTSRCWISLRPL